MTIRSCLQTLAPVLWFGAMPNPGASHRPEVDGRQIATVTCRFDFYVDRDDGGGPAGKFEVRGTPRNPHYLVDFRYHQGSACLERHAPLWPETFVLRIRGWSDTILIVSLLPDGFGEMQLRSVPDKKWVNYYDDRGSVLDHPTDKAIQIETEETADGLEVKVTLPRQARSIRKLSIKYWATAW